MMEKIMLEIQSQMMEQEEEFILRTITPFCNDCVDKVINKEDLKKAILKYYGKVLTANDYQDLAMRTNDGKATARLIDRIDMISFFKDAKAGRPIENIDLGGVLNACLGLSGEVGEFNDVVKKWLFHEKDVDLMHLKRELGDICWYIAMMCQSFGWEMEDIMQLNVDKLKARYPEGFDVQRANNRKKGDI